MQSDQKRSRRASIPGKLKFQNDKQCDAANQLVLGRYTEIPNWYPIFWNTDTDTDVGIHNTEKYRISTIKYRKYRKSVRYLPPGTENFITERVRIYTVSQKKLWSRSLAITLSNLNRFQKFLHCCREKEISNKPCVIISTTP